MTLKEYIDQLQTEINLSDDEFDREEMGRVDGLRYALHLAKQISEDQPIFFKDNPPSEETDVLVYDGNRWDVAALYSAFGNSWFETWEDTIEITNNTYWMPLPEPPTGGD